MYKLPSKKLRKLERTMLEAPDYEQWSEAARAHDEKTGAHEWRKSEKTNRYDHVQIRRRIDALRKLRADGNDHGLLFALNEGVHGNMGGMGKAELYSEARFGTKVLVEEYVNEIADALEYIAQLDNKTISREEKLDFFERASHCYGRSALMLSGGGTLGTFHVGVLKALIESDVLPDVISGSSAGSIITAVAGTHTNQELMDMSHRHAMLKMKDEGAETLKKFIFERVDSEDVVKLLERMIPDLTFQEAFEKTGRHINISIAPAELHQTSRLMNAITSPNVYIRTAVMASCAVPGVFPSVMLEAKNEQGQRQPYLPTRRWVDGSVADDLPAKRLARLYGVNHYIGSLINPIVLFSRGGDGDHTNVPYVVREVLHRTALSMVRTGRYISLNYTKKWKRFNLFVDMLNSALSQKYSADINIYPDFQNFDMTKLLGHLNEIELMMLERQGEVATWQKLERIKTSSKISRTLDKILEQYNAGEFRHKTRKTKAITKAKQTRNKAA